MTDQERLNYQRMNIWTTLVYQEQAIYWQRFAGLASLHAGLLVLVTSTALEYRHWSRFLIELMALILALIWSLIQLRSLSYVDRWKPGFHEERMKLGIDYDGEKFGSDPRRSSTDFGLLIPLAIMVIWIVELYGNTLPKLAN